MANVLFEVDASKIIAKLHLAGIMAVNHLLDGGKKFIVNTGIVNDDPKLKPDDPKNVSFNLDNTSGTYEVGLVEEVEYTKTFGLEDAIDSLSDFVAQVSGKKSAINDTDDKSKEFRKQIDISKKMLASTLGIKEDDEVFNLTISGDAKKTKDGIAKLKSLARTKVEKDAAAYQKMIEEYTKDALNVLFLYMQSFAGADNVKMNASDIAAIPISENAKDSNSKGLVSNFEIEPMPQAEQKKMEAQFRAIAKEDYEKPNCRHKMCFKVKYTLTIDK